jgi:uncharacterized protein (DUF58 family)
MLFGLVLVMRILSSYRGWTALLVGLGGLWLFAYLWAKSLARGIRLKREVRFGWAQVGDQLDERFTLIQEGWAPGIWVEVEDQSTLPEYPASRVTGVGNAGARNQWKIKATCKRRGVFTLGPTRLKGGDPFGIYSALIEYPQSTRLVVTPPILALPSIRVAPAGRTGDGGQRVNALERCIGSAGLREYLPGDSLRWIHWPSTAHQGSLFVRLLEGVSSGDWWILLNLEETAQAGDGYDSTLELGIILAASMTDTGLRERHRVGLLMAGEKMVWLPPQSDEEQRWHILQELAQAKVGTCRFSDLLFLCQSYIHQAPGLILITPPANGEWISALVPLVMRGAVATVLLLDPTGFGGEDDLYKVIGVLADLGAAYYVLGRDLLHQPEAHPGRWGRWEWKVGATGRAIPLRRPKDLSWKQLI